MFLLLVVTGILSLFICGVVAAHSTKGLMKAPLKKDALTVNDVAFFVESFVMRELYNDKNFRFIVKDFVSVKQEGRKAVVDFEVFDKKDNRSFPEKMEIAQGTDGVWSYTPKGGEPVAMFTFVSKGSQAGGGSLQELLMGGFALAAAVLGVFVIRKKANSGSLVGSA